MASPRQTWPKSNEKKKEIFLGAMKRAFAEGSRLGFSAGVDGRPVSDEKFMDGVDWWSFDERAEPAKKAGKATGRAEKKVTPKKPELSNDLASADFNPDCCMARFWNQKDAGDLSPDQPGHGMQCWRSPSVDGYCLKCLEKKANPESRTSTSHWFGDFNKPLTESPGEKKDGTPLEDWPALKKNKQKKEKTEKKEKKEKKSKKKKHLKKKKAKKEPVEEDGMDVIQEPVVEEPVVEEPDVEEPVDEGAGVGLKPVKIQDNVEIIEHENSAGEKVEVEIHRHDHPEEEDEATQDLSEDELGADDGPEMPEIDVNGFTLLWNKKTNQLIDPDDGEVMGTRVADEAGEWTNQMKEDDGSGSESDGSDSEDEEEQ